MTHRTTLMALVATIILASATLFCPSGIVTNVSAEVEYGYFQTLFPSSNNSTFYRFYPDPTSPVSAPGAQVHLDGDSQNIYYADDAYYELTCSDFSNESFPTGTQYATIPENATILEVWVAAFFLSYRPSLSLGVSVAGGAFNSTLTDSGHGPYFWNVTQYADWTHDLLVHDDTTIAFLASTDGGTDYYVGYLGFYKIIWQGWHEAEGQDQPPPEPYVPPVEPPPSLDIITEYSILGILGFIGFAGMFILPAAAVWIHKQGTGESKIVLFVNMLAAWTLCFAMFLVSVY